MRLVLSGTHGPTSADPVYPITNLVMISVMTPSLTRPEPHGKMSVVCPLEIRRPKNLKTQDWSNHSITVYLAK